MISRSDDTVLDVASAIQKLTAYERECEREYQVECARVITRASQSTEPNGIRNAMLWQWKAEFARKAIAQLKGAYDKGASDVVAHVLNAEPATAEIERMLEHLPRRFAEGCRVGPFTKYPKVEAPRDWNGVNDYPKINEEGPRHTATIGTGGKRRVMITHALIHDTIGHAFLAEKDLRTVVAWFSTHCGSVYYDQNTGYIYNQNERVATVDVAYRSEMAAVVRTVATMLDGQFGGRVTGANGVSIGSVG